MDLGPPPGSAPSEAGFEEREGSTNGEGTGGLGAMLRALKDSSSHEGVSDTDDDAALDDASDSCDSSEGETALSTAEGGAGALGVT